MNKNRTLTQVIRFSIAAIIVVIVVSGCKLPGGGPSYKDNVQFFAAEAQVVFDRDVVGANAKWDALRVNTPAAKIDISQAITLEDTYEEQAELIDAEVTALLALNPKADVGASESAMSDLRTRHEAFISMMQAEFASAQEALDLYKVVIQLPEYNKEQKQATNKCKKALEDGKWQEALTQCEVAKEKGVPPTPTNTPAPTRTPGPIPSVIPLTQSAVTPIGVATEGPPK